MRAVGFFCEHPLQGVLHSNPTEVITFHCPRPKCSKEWTGPVRKVLEAYRDHVLESDHVFELVLTFRNSMATAAKTGSDSNGESKHCRSL
jgi:hypothetical protein